MFAPLPESSNNSTPTHIRNWIPPGSQKSTVDDSQYPRSPVKHESAGRSNTSNASGNDCSENGDSNQARALDLDSKNSSTTSGAPYLGENNFYAFPTPPKEETETGVPLTPTSVMSSSSSKRSAQRTPSGGASLSDRKSISSEDPCQQTSAPATPQNQQVYQQLGTESKLLSAQTSSTSAMISYSHPYKQATSGEYNSTVTSHQSTTNCGKTTLTTYMSKNKSKNRATTGESLIFLMYLLL